MAKKREYRRHPVGMKQQAVARMASGANITALARELEINRTLLYVWKRNACGQPYGSEGGGPQDLRDQRIRELQAKIGELEGALGRKVQEVDFFAAALRGIAARRQEKRESGERGSTGRSAGVPKRKAN